MNISVLLKDSLRYPLNNIPSLLIYCLLGIISGIVVGGTLTAVVFSVAAGNVLATIGSGIVGIVVSVFIDFVISGYALDIIKYAIENNSGAPGIDFFRQFFNGVKLFAVSITYLFVPIIISAVLAIFFNQWVVILVAFVLFVIFSLALFMAQCRLAKTEDLLYALNIPEAIRDVARVGFIELLLFIIIISLISLVLFIIAGFITQWNSIVGGIVMGIVSVYLVFFTNRVVGLLYSKV